MNIIKPPLGIASLTTSLLTRRPVLIDKASFMKIYINLAFSYFRINENEKANIDKFTDRRF